METNKLIYRLLTKEELSNLEKEFVYFLSTQGVDADAWIQIKNTNEKLAVDYLIVFSNFIFDNVLNETSYLVRNNINSSEVFHCQQNQLVKLEVTSERVDVDFKSLDLLNPVSYKDTNLLNISVFEKPYSQAGRSMDIFQLMETGCGIVDGKLYKGLCMML